MSQVKKQEDSAESVETEAGRIYRFQGCQSRWWRIRKGKYENLRRKRDGSKVKRRNERHHAGEWGGEARSVCSAVISITVDGIMWAD